ncbi:Shc1p [Saccharomyces eubayanus]|uniref:Shc1p n=1 Tax=Saccharomyces eubayanus TaxID=1080349 RepID=UPI0006C50EBD|nr:SHC1-like protein [Saccharomyces eubayanus]KOH00048.1 SHC1-like protein [Saccharomyces eubayanus]
MFTGVYPNTPGTYPEVTARKYMDRQSELNMFSTASSLALNELDARQYWSVSSHISGSSSMYSAGGEENLRSASTDPIVCLPGFPTDDRDSELISSAVGEDSVDSNPSFAEKFNTFPTKGFLSEDNGFAEVIPSSPEGKSRVSFESEISSEISKTTPPNGTSVYEALVEPPPSQNESVALSFGHSNDLDFLNNPSGSGSSNDVNRSSGSISLPKNVSLDFNVDNNLFFTNELVASESHKMAKFHLGKRNAKSLLTRWKTIEMYGESVKRTDDTYSNFQFAQYILKVGLNLENLQELVEEQELAEEQEGKSGSFTVDSLKESLLMDAKIILKKLSAVGYPDAQYLLGDAYSSGVFGKVKNRRAFLLFLAAAKRLHIESIFRTAICYECGLGVTRNASKAVNFLTFAATKNHPAAMYKLGVYSFHGLMGLPEDILTKLDGYRWLRRATSMANSLICGAPYELANIYMTGFKDLIISDPDYAMVLYKKAAILGHTESARILAEACGNRGISSRRNHRLSHKLPKASDNVLVSRKLI